MKNDASIFFEQVFKEVQSNIMVQFKSLTLFDIYNVKSLDKLKPVLLKICLNKTLSKNECDQILNDVFELETKLENLTSSGKITETKIEKIHKYKDFANQLINNTIQVWIFKIKILKDDIYII